MVQDKNGKNWNTINTSVVQATAFFDNNVRSVMYIIVYPAHLS